MTCVWWPTAMPALGGGPQPNPAWPIFSFLSSSGWRVWPISLKTQIYIHIKLLYSTFKDFYRPP